MQDVFNLARVTHSSYKKISRRFSLCKKIKPNNLVIHDDRQWNSEISKVKTVI